MSRTQGESGLDAVEDFVQGHARDEPRDNGLDLVRVDNGPGVWSWGIGWEIGVGHGGRLHAGSVGSRETAYQGANFNR